MSVPNPVCSTFHISDLQESGYISSSNEPPKDVLIKKTKLNRSFRTRISLLLKKRHAKQQEQIPTTIDEDYDHQHSDVHDEINNKKLTLSQRFDTLRRSFHIGNRNSINKGKRHLLSNE